MVLQAIFALAAVTLVAAGSTGDLGREAASPSPRGVDPAAATAYPALDARTKFTCDGGGTSVDVARINDEYCDCKDGTDEPGTSACLNGVFHCRNRGHQPKKLPASQVNDGVCDCCDGSDEHGGRVQCGNACGALGASFREELAETVRRAREGVDKKRVLVAAAPAKREAWQKDIARLTKEIDRQTLKTEKAMKLKSNAERAEKAANSAAEALTKLQEAKEAVEAAAKKLEDAEKDPDPAATADAVDAADAADAVDAADAAILDADVNAEAEADADTSVGNDDTKAAETDEERGQRIARQWIKAPKTDTAAAAAVDAADAANTPATDDDNEVAETDDERGQRIARQWIKDDGGDVDGDDVHPGEKDAAEEGDNHHADANVDEDENKDEDEEPMFEKPLDWDDEEDGLWLPPDGPEIAEHADRLRERHTEATTALTALEDAQRDLRAHLARHTGPDDEFAHMIGECYVASVEKYEYKVCPFGDASQDHTRLGTMAPLSREEPRVFRFTGGEKCWNGPGRSITVTAACGGQPTLVGVNEPSRCEYAATLLTPAACDEGEVARLEEELRALEGEVIAAQHDEF